MSRPVRLALLAAALLSPAPADAMDDFMRASRSGPLAMTFCTKNSDGSKIEGGASKFCKAHGYDKLVAAVDASFAAAVGKAPANVRPLLKRDQVWFNEMIEEAATTVQEVDAAEIRRNFAATLRQRVPVLNGIAAGFGRAGLNGKWTNTFGAVSITVGDNGAYRVTAELSSNYGSDKHWQCKLGATVKPSGNGWLSGAVDRARPAQSTDAGAPQNKPTEPLSIKLRRQGDTLRLVLVATDEQWDGFDDSGCESLGQITGTYFASGKSDATDKADTTFVKPTFDCTHPDTATDEEICADPELAENDQRLNRAWKALLPRLDETTRHALTEDQRHWVRSQADQFPEFLHPGWEKRTSEMHYTVNARDHLSGLQRERIALLEGFDEKRDGLAGTWLAYNAIIKITIDKDGGLEANGWKWEQGDWKAGCDYEMSGSAKNAVFTSKEQGKNPDTLERDHAMLIVNRLDDDFARKRYTDNGIAGNADEAKCKRRLDISSTARLFPAQPSPDIDRLPGIR
ncbi:lysozyme inhibitor LprI family protein [Bradyrhizobium sp. CCBAU 51745]|uniref:lysozyme inhibitor LprI family protein n=1 Tax=Bradyrhizobium sp. CCBAU 51745 TaxID=1325099 RepID=UPI002306D6D3|nr:lysozyme inhibitor LprI family protein [Bradyrhizobium sp. CCBAU 51745]